MIDGGSESILVEIRELCQRLGVETPPELALWQDVYYGASGQANRPFSANFSRTPNFGRLVSTHFPVIIKDKILLSTKMKGKLNPEEWIPLLASSIIFYKQLRGRKTTGSLLRYSPALLLMAAFFALAGAGIATQSSPLSPIEFIILGAIVLPAVLAFSSLRVLRYTRNLGLAADGKTFELIGRDRLLEALQKVEMLKQQDLRVNKYADWDGYGDTPTLSQRLKNIQNIPIYKTQ